MMGELSLLVQCWVEFFSFSRVIFLSSLSLLSALLWNYKLISTSESSFRKHVKTEIFSSDCSRLQQVPLGKSLFQHFDALFGFDFVNAASMWTVAGWDPEPRNLATTRNREEEWQTHVFHWRGRNPDTPSCTERIWPHPGTESKPFWYPPPELLSPEEAKTHRCQQWGYRKSRLNYWNIMKNKTKKDCS